MVRYNAWRMRPEATKMPRHCVSLCLIWGVHTHTQNKICHLGQPAGYTTTETSHVGRILTDFFAHHCVSIGLVTCNVLLCKLCVFCDVCDGSPACTCTANGTKFPSWDKKGLKSMLVQPSSFTEFNLHKELLMLQGQKLSIISLPAQNGVKTVGIVCKIHFKIKFKQCLSFACHNWEKLIK